MQYNPLGHTGLHVSRLCLGTMTFSEGASPHASVIGYADQATADEMVNRAIDAGINFFDTANMYSDGESERMLGKALGNRRRNHVIATKVYFHSRTGMNDLGTSRLAIMREVEDSLRRLGTDYIDLYQVHCWDHTTPLEETLRALDDLVRQGKVRYIGLSNFAAWQIATADGLARRLGTERFCSVQAYYSLVGRELERGIIPAISHHGLGLMVWSPLAGGFLSGKFSGDGSGEGRRRIFDFPPVHPERGDAVVEVLRAIGTARDASPARVALAWLLHQPAVSTVIIGARRLAQFEDNLAAIELKLSAVELQRLDEASRLTPEYPQWIQPMDRGTDRMKVHAKMLKDKQLAKDL